VIDPATLTAVDACVHGDRHVGCAHPAMTNPAWASTVNIRRSDTTRCYASFARAPDISHSEHGCWHACPLGSPPCSPWHRDARLDGSSRRTAAPGSRHGRRRRGQDTTHEIRRYARLRCADCGTAGRRITLHYVTPLDEGDSRCSPGRLLHRRGLGGTGPRRRARRSGRQHRLLPHGPARSRPVAMPPLPRWWLVTRRGRRGMARPLSRVS